MKNYILLLLLLFTVCNSKAQVGINTETPQSTMHIHGDLQFSKALNVGGNSTTKGNSGTEGQLLVSQGIGMPPIWNDAEDVQIPQEILFFKKSNTNTVNANNDYSVAFDSPIIINELIEFNNNNPSEFTFKKQGNYQLTFYVRYEVVTPSLAQGIASTKLQKTVANNSSIISGQTSGYANNTSTIDHNFTFTDHMNEGDRIKLITHYTKAYRIVNASIAIQSLGK